ncbi:MAG TPA: BamA/TamA family outer membrane protein [Polyangia bacterium]|nr:BamA/TamA family outer membrane protein [Polyangia bacterium]
MGLGGGVWAGLIVVGALASPARAGQGSPAAPATADGARPPAEVVPASAAPVAEKPAPTPPETRWDWAVFPVVFYAPETSFGFVGGLAIFEDTPKAPGEQRRDDTVALGLQATLRKQYQATLSVTKFWDDARWQLTEDAAVVKFPNFFWGIGDDTTDGAKEPFTQSGVFSRVTVARLAFEQVFVGAGLTTAWYDITGETANGPVDAYLQGSPRSGPALGVGPILRRDTRDDAIGAHRGSLSSFAATFFPTALGGSYRYAFYELDHRSHFQLGSRSVLAMEAYGAWAPGQVPLAEVPALGGSSRLRGYFMGRYRDHLYVMGQAEWRVRVYGRFSLAPFAAVGNVFSSPSAISLERPKYAAGLSVRFSLKKDRDLNIHVDGAISPTSSGIYLNMGEAF